MNNEAAPPFMPFGLDPHGIVYFCLALIAGAIIVVFFAWRRFDERTLERTDGDLITQFLPRELASPQEYAQGLMTYIVAMLGVMLIFSALGTPALTLLGLSTQVAPLAPVLIALALFKLVPNVPVLSGLEQNIREFAHRRAFIPAAARATASRLTAADFDFAEYRAITDDEMSGVAATDFDKPRGSIEYNWARLCSLCYALRSRQSMHAEEIDGRLLTSYRTDLDSIYDRRTDLEARIAQFRADPANTALRKQVRTDITDALQKLYIFIGCAVRLRTGKAAEIDRVLRRFGFVLPPVPPQSNADAMAIGFVTVGVSVYFVCFGGMELAQLKSWAVSPYFPQNPIDPFMWALSAVLAHGAAIFVANSLRRRWADDWYVQTDADRRRSIANYARVAVLCAGAAFAVFLLLGFAVQTPTWAMVKGSAPYALMPAATGVFFVYHLDSVALGVRPAWRAVEVLPQALITAFFGFAASQIWIGLGGAQPPGAPSGLDFVLLVAAMGFVVGAALAWCVPRYALASANDPLTRAQTARVQQVRAIAAERMGSAAAEGWLSTANPSLDDLSPLGALADVRNHEEVLRLLNQLSGSAVAAARAGGTSS
jgi:hypothetical protein